jgi:hypothetical protein
MGRAKRQQRGEEMNRTCFRCGEEIQGKLAGCVTVCKPCSRSIIENERIRESLAWTLSVCEELLRDGNEQEQYLMRKARKALEGAR